MTTIRVALAEDNVLLREGISRLVAANDDFELVGVASDLPGLLSVVAEHDPDVVITDIRMPPTGTSDRIARRGVLAEDHDADLRPVLRRPGSTGHRSASWSAASTPRLAMRSRCSKRARRAVPTCSRS